ncbi:hypothetical protein Leryth_023121 [Lithospermum erythrorhizon]|nr:hypothetical protein Leryth_023121 [Lithospermum erythrorhizon]
MIPEKHYLLVQISEGADRVRDEVMQMRALLRAADANEENGDTEAKKWLFQVQEVAYDAQDILDKFKQITYDVNHSQTNGFLAKVLKNFNSRNDSAVYVEQIASELETIQERINNVFEVQKYRLIYANLEQGLSMNLLNESQGDECIEEEIDLVGIHIRNEELVSWITSADPGKKVLSVIGKAGIGKTSLVKNVYNGEIVMKHFDIHLYITVEKSYSGVHILLSIMTDIFGEIPPEEYQQLMSLTINDWREIIGTCLQEKKYIIFVDEIVEKDVWEEIKDAFPENRKGSRVVVITSSHEVAGSVSLKTGSSVIGLKPLSQEESWILFCKKAFPNRSCPHKLMEISRNTVNQLDGLPRALHMISGALRRKKKTVEEWETFYHKLLVALETSNKSEAIRDIISLAYKDLPSYLKPCFLYLSIFPQGHDIEKTILLRLWASEGLLELKERETADEVGERYINELVNRSLLQIEDKFVDGRLKFCSIQNVVHDFIISKGREQNISTTDLSCPNKVRRFIIYYSINNNQTGTSFEHLRSLVNVGYKGSLSKSFLSELLYGGKKHMLLKVVDLKGAQLNKIPEGIFNMFHLEYLNLSHTKISTVPRSIGELPNLQFLNLKHTPVRKLPKEILKLRQLQHLLVNRREFGNIVGCKVPRNIGTLVSLKKLADVKANDTEIVKGIGNLTQLTMLGITRFRRKDGMNLCLSLQKLTNLRILNINALQGNEVVDLQHSASPALPFLRTLAIRGRMEKMPLWIASQHSLAIVHLVKCALRETPMGTVEDLPNLSELLLDGA